MQIQILNSDDVKAALKVLQFFFEKLDADIK